MSIKHQFEVKDSGQREKYDSGMVRDLSTNKINIALCYDGPMFERWAEHITKGAVKYAKRNWMKSNGLPELERFKESAARHFFQWMRGDIDEDHAAATYFNINAYEYLKTKLAVQELQAKNNEQFRSGTSEKNS